MNQSFYNAALGAQQQMLRMNVQANNIANINTYGYKAEKPAFQTLMYSMVEGADNQVPKGSGMQLSGTTTDFSKGIMMQTDRSQDYAISGDGFFALYDPETEEITYTRDGSFTLSMYQEPDEEGRLQEVFYLSDGEGRQVLDVQGYPIVVTDPEERQPVGTFVFEYQDGLHHVGGGMFAALGKSETVWVGNAEVVQGFLESSNVDLTTELTKVIEAQQSYSYALKMVQTADEIETTVINLRN